MILLLNSCGKEGRIIYKLSGEDWTIVSADSGTGVRDGYYSDNYPLSEAVPSKVPGDIHYDLERAEIIPDLYFGKNTQIAQWVTGKEWWYRKVFKPGEEWAGKKTHLRFEAVDYLASVWLNSRYLGKHEGQFTPFEFDVTDILESGRENILIVQIYPVPEKVRKKISEVKPEWEVMGAMRPAYPYWKSMTSSGWDWGADLVSMGIWQDINLIATTDVYVSNLTVLPEVLPQYGKAILNIRYNLHLYKDKQVKLTYQTKCLTADDKESTIETRIYCLKGNHDISGALEIQDPKLWWPNGYGPQHLYELMVKVDDNDNGKNLDQFSVTFGIRHLEVLGNPLSSGMKRYKDYNPDYEPGRELDIPDSIQFPDYLISINGRRIMGMGANWLPCDLLFGRPDEEAYEHLIRLASKADFNLFRIWGGGIIEKQIFFDLCDRYGIMLFAEFPNGGVRLPETDEALEITASETRQILPLMMNHPSIVRYGGGNEWYTNANNSRQMAQLRRICNEVDPTRPFHDPDPETIGQRHGPHGYVYETHYKTYNEFYPLTSGPDDPFEWTEYGTSGASSVKTLKRILPQESLWPIKSSDPYWIWHKGSYAYGADNWLASSQYTHLFGQLPDLETTIRCSQFVQAEGLRYANQSMRRNQWHRSGFASWTYNEPWPNAAHGCLVEYYGQPKMAYYYAKKSCAAIDISCIYSNLECSHENPLDLDVWISSNKTEEVPGAAFRWRIYNTHGQKWNEGTNTFTGSPDQSEMAGKIHWQPLPGMEGDVALLYLEVLDAGGKILADNLYTFGIMGPGHESHDKISPVPPLKGLLQAPQAELEILNVQAKKIGTNEAECIIEVKNTGKIPGLFVELTIDNSDDISVIFSDNYFFLPEGQKRLIIVNLIDKNPDNVRDQVKLSVKAWNSALRTSELRIN